MMLQAFDKFIAMGGFGDYVWSAYGVTAFVLLWLLISTLRNYRKTIPKKATKLSKIEMAQHAPNT